MVKSHRFSEALLAEFRKAKILGVRAGATHRYTGVWVVVVEDRVFVRSWNDKPTGWYRAFAVEPRGSVQLRSAVSDAYAAKYDTKASQKWVLGFAEPARELATLELLPA
jgi:hypothetical protein